MIKYIFILIFLFFVQIKYSQIKDSIIELNNIKTKKLDLDSIIIQCVFFGNFSWRNIKVCKNEISVFRDYDGKKEKTIYATSQRKKLLSYLNQFYIKKTEKIILKKQKINYIIYKDFPRIRVISYKKGKEIFNKETSIGEPQYKVKFNPKFLEFYHFLKSLLREPFRQ